MENPLLLWEIGPVPPQPDPVHCTEEEEAEEEAKGWGTIPGRQGTKEGRIFERDPHGASLQQGVPAPPGHRVLWWEHEGLLPEVKSL